MDEVLVRAGEMVLEDLLANERPLAAADTLLFIEVAVGDVGLLEDETMGNDWILLVVVEMLLEVGDWSVADDALTGSEDR